MTIRTVILALSFAAAVTAEAQQKPTPVPAGDGKPPVSLTVPEGVPTPADYVIGAEDVLGIVFWREKDMSADVVVRPDGMITLPLINEVKAAGLTPDQLKNHLATAAKEFLKTEGDEKPSVSVTVKTINSRKVHIMGAVAKTGPYPLTSSMTVLQLIAAAGGLQEFADTKNITILRTENGKQIALKFDYKKVSRGQNLEQNIELKPGDTIIVRD